MQCRDRKQKPKQSNKQTWKIKETLDFEEQVKIFQNVKNK